MCVCINYKYMCVCMYACSNTVCVHVCEHACVCVFALLKGMRIKTHPSSQQYFPCVLCMKSAISCHKVCWNIYGHMMVGFLGQAVWSAWKFVHIHINKNIKVVFTVVLMFVAGWLTSWHKLCQEILENKKSRCSIHNLPHSQHVFAIITLT